jgi:hypothetical protein
MAMLDVFSRLRENGLIYRLNNGCGLVSGELHFLPF